MRPRHEPLTAQTAWYAQSQHGCSLTQTQTATSVCLLHKLTALHVERRSEENRPPQSLLRVDVTEIRQINHLENVGEKRLRTINSATPFNTTCGNNNRIGVDVSLGPHLQHMSCWKRQKACEAERRCQLRASAAAWEQDGRSHSTDGSEVNGEDRESRGLVRMCPLVNHNETLSIV